MLSSFKLTAVMFFFFFNDTATTEIYTLSLHDALPISATLIGTNRLHGGADPAARDVAALEQLGDDAGDRCDRNCGRQWTTQCTGVDAVNVPARVDQRAATEPGIDREVRLQPAIDLAAFPGAPFAAGRADGTECGAGATLV